MPRSTASISRMVLRPSDPERSEKQDGTKIHARKRIRLQYILSLIEGRAVRMRILNHIRGKPKQVVLAKGMFCN